MRCALGPCRGMIMQGRIALLSTLRNSFSCGSERLWPVFLSSWRVTALENKWDHFVNYDLENLEKGKPESRKKVEGGSGPLSTIVLLCALAFNEENQIERLFSDKEGLGVQVKSRTGGRPKPMK